MNELIYGKNNETGVVSIEIDNDIVYTFFKDGTVKKEPMTYYILWNRQLSDRHIQLNGDAHYKYATKYDNKAHYKRVLDSSRNRHDFYTPWNTTEQHMIKSGVTQFMDTTIDEVSVLSFDIETTGLFHNDDSKVLLISNTFRDSNGNIEKKLFSFDEHFGQKELINEWCKWVKEKDPSFMLGHNIYGYDLPYIAYCYGSALPLGRNNKKMVISKGTRQFRKDASQTYDFKNIYIFGRQLVDTFFLSIKYDIARKFPSYGLKPIIKHLGLEKEGREFYDASTIGKNYRKPEEFKKIKAYAIDDADDSLALFDIMAPNFFYYARSIPKSFQEICVGASGSQINSMMVRSYIQNAYGVPKASGRADFEGAISIGNPGIYKDCFKMDIASLYPSIILQYQIYDEVKDPNANLLKMVEIFTTERLKNKALAKETNDNYYDALQNAQKIIINSFYGFMGSVGLNFNSPANAALITRHGRDILTKCLDWTKDNGYSVINADTDSIMISNGEVIGSFKRTEILKDVNALLPDKVIMENDGYFTDVLIVKAKNYVMVDEAGNKTTKGSALKATMKEPRLKTFIDEFITGLMNNESLVDLYNAYSKEILSISDMTPWVSKKTVTKAVLSPQRTQEERIKAAIGRTNVSEGDKIHIFFKTETEMALLSDFDGVYSIKKLLGKLFNTVKIFDNVIPKSTFLNYTLKRNQDKLNELKEIS